MVSFRGRSDLDRNDGKSQSNRRSSKSRTQFQTASRSIWQYYDDDDDDDTPGNESSVHRLAWFIALSFFFLNPCFLLTDQSSTCAVKDGMAGT